MSKYIKLFDNTEDYLDTLDEIKASEEGLRVLVSRCEPQEEGDRPTIHYDIYPGVLVTYNVSSITGDTKLCTTTNYRTVEIDSENEDVKYTDYKFSSKGEHLVRFRGFDTDYAIDDEFFKECTELIGFVLDEDIVNLGVSCFEGCTALKFINIPKTVKYIGDNAFRNSSETDTKCTYYVNATTPPTLGQTAFTKRKVEAIYVPSESVEAYKTAPNWSNYADLIMAATN